MIELNGGKRPSSSEASELLMDALVEDPALAPIGHAMLEALVTDESVRALVNQLLTDW